MTDIGEQEEQEKEQTEITLLPRFWTQRIKHSPTKENPGDPTRFLYCEAVIVSPLGVTLEGKDDRASSMIEDDQGDEDKSSEDEQRRWNDLVCEVAIYTGEAAVYDWENNSRRRIEGGVGLFNFRKGFIDSTDGYPPSISCWFTLDDEEFQDVWQRIGKLKSTSPDTAARSGEVATELENRYSFSPIAGAGL